MNEKIKYVSNISIAKDYSPAALFGKAQAEAVRKFHKSFPAYEPTKLYSLDNLARIMGVGKFYVKDESSRFGLNAFKGLGGSYAIGKILSERAGISEEEMTYTRLQQENVKAATRGMTFVTATDGNHGRGIAWTARELGIDAVIYMPKGSSEERLENIRSLGARAEITDMNYDAKTICGLFCVYT